MKTIVGILAVVILGMIVIIFVLSGDNETNSIAIKEVNVDRKALKAVQKGGGMAIDEEMCNKMPGMKGCKEFLNNLAANTQVDSAIEITGNNPDLGDIPMDEGKIDIVFKIKNTGTEDIILGDANGSCFCTQGNIANLDGSGISVNFNTIGQKKSTNLKRILKAGETQVVTAIYDPEAHGPNAVGPTARGLTIKTNSKYNSELKLNFFGNVVKTRTK